MNRQDKIVKGIVSFIEWVPKTRTHFDRISKYLPTDKKSKIERLYYGVSRINAEIETFEDNLHRFLTSALAGAKGYNANVSHAQKSFRRNLEELWADFLFKNYLCYFHKDYKKWDLLFEKLDRVKLDERMKEAVYQPTLLWKNLGVFDIQNDGTIKKVN